MDSEERLVVPPSEIYHLIITEVALDATRSRSWESVRSDLIPCCLVAKPFVQICREYILQDITVYNTGQNSQMQALVSFWRLNPRSATYVRKLTWRLGLQGEMKTYNSTLMSTFLGMSNVERLASHSKIPIDYSITANLVKHYLPMGGIMEVFVSHVDEISLLAFLESPVLKALYFRKCTISSLQELQRQLEHPYIKLH